MGWDKDRDITNYCHRQNRLNVGKLMLFIACFWQTSAVRTKNQLKMPPPFSTSSPQMMQGNREGGCGQSIMLHLFCSSMVTLCLCFMWSPSHRMPFLPNWSCELLTGCSPPSTASRWFHASGPIHQEQTVLAQVPKCGSSLCPPAPPRAPLQRAADLAQGCSCMALRGLQPPLGHIHCCMHHGLLYGCTWRSALRCACRLQGDSLLHRGPLLACRKLLLHAWNTSYLTSALTLRAARLLLSYFSLFFLSCCCTPVLFSLKSALPEVHWVLLMGSALAVVGLFWSFLEMSLIWRGAAAGLCSQRPTIYTSC